MRIYLDPSVGRYTIQITAGIIIILIIIAAAIAIPLGISQHNKNKADMNRNVRQYGQPSYPQNGQMYQPPYPKNGQQFQQPPYQGYNPQTNNYQNPQQMPQNNNGFHGDMR